MVVEKEGQTIVVTATPEAAPEEMKSITLNLGPGDVPTLDPSLATDTSSIQVLWEIMMGLTRQDEVTNEVQPAMAKDWDMSEDGKVYTFHLRDDISWVKYDAVSDSVVQVMDCQETPAPRMVNANDIYYGMLRTLLPDTGSDYAYVLAFAVDGATAYNNGETDDPATVGVKVVDDYTLEITFVEPAAYNAAIAGMWVAYPQPSWLIDGDDCTEARGDRWTETGFNQGFGPYALKEWVHDCYITVVKNPFWPADIASAPQPRLKKSPGPCWTTLPLPNTKLANPMPPPFRWRTWTVSSLTRYCQRNLVIAPNLCTYYYGFNTTAPVVDDVRVRRALSMAIDRQALIDNVLKGEQVPAQWFSRPGLAGAPTLESHPDLGVKSDVEAAKAELQSYLDEKGVTADYLDITLMFNTSSGHQKIAEAIQQMWKDNLGLNVKLVNQEWAVYLETITERRHPADLPHGLVPGLRGCQQLHPRSLLAEWLCQPGQGRQRRAGRRYQLEGRRFHCQAARSGQRTRSGQACRSVRRS